MACSITINLALLLCMERPPLISESPRRDTARMMAQENVEILRALYERFARGNFLTPEAIDPEVQFERIGATGAGGAGSWHGIAEMEAAFSDYMQAFHGLRVEGERFVELEDERVLVFSRHRGV